MKTYNTIHKSIVEKIYTNTPFSLKKTDQIVNKYFKKVPSNVKILINKYKFHQKRVLDIGCSYGNTLLYWGKGSEGIELQSDPLKLLNALNIRNYQVNVEDSLIQIKNKYEGIFSNNLIEHLVSPHLFLINLYNILSNNGLLALAHPIIPMNFSKLIWNKIYGYESYLAVEHINFYTPDTIKCALERAGFTVMMQVNAGMYNLSPWLGRQVTVFSPDILTICKKNNQFLYPEKRLKAFDPKWGTILHKFHCN